ncbi:MAG: HNH endonuclease [Terriglobia bacterium]
MMTGPLTSASPEWTRWLERITSLRPDKAHPALGDAPQKPILLLVLCDLVEEGKLDGGLLKRDGDLAFRYSSYWRVVAPRRQTKADLTFPFYHLKSEGFWQPLDAGGRPATDRHISEIAQLDVSFLVCLAQAEFRLLARRTLIAKYFQPEERAELYSLVELPVPPEDVVGADASRFMPDRESESQRDAKFAVRVLPAYDYTCALTRYRMIALNGKTVLDAAHIHQFKQGGSNHPTNGIALSKTAHWLFDQGFWSISNDYNILVAEDRFDERGDAAHLLKPRVGNSILRPQNQHYLPDRESLRWHRQRHGFEHQ